VEGKEEGGRTREEAGVVTQRNGKPYYDPLTKFVYDEIVISQESQMSGGKGGRRLE
jgi:hypothetical protein